MIIEIIMTAINLDMIDKVHDWRWEVELLQPAYRYLRQYGIQSIERNNRLVVILSAPLMERTHKHREILTARATEARIVEAEKQKENQKKRRFWRKLF